MTIMISVKNKRKTSKVLETQLMDLKNSLQKEFSRNKVSIHKVQAKEGQMGLGISNLIYFIFDRDKIEKVISFFQNYLRSKKVSLVLQNAQGEKIELSANLDREQIAMLLNNFFQREIMPQAPIEKSAKQNPKQRRT